VIGQAQSQLVELPQKRRECCTPDLVRLPSLRNSLNATRGNFIDGSAFFSNDNVRQAVRGVR
jgi:hypothetical protein